jgi:hypothetical protein
MNQSLIGTFKRFGRATLILSLSVISCKSDIGAPEDTGLIQVTANTTGEDQGPGYTIAAGNQRHAIGSSGHIVFPVDEGVSVISIEGVPQNCLVADRNTRTVRVNPGETVDVSFSIDCAATGIVIITRTTGSDVPDAYSAQIDNQIRSISVNDSVRITRLLPGSHSVSFDLRADNCSIDRPSLVVEVMNRTVTPLRFDVTCTTAVRLPKIAYVTATNSGFNSLSEITLANPDGSTPQLLASGTSPSWSPDGKRILYSTYNCDIHYGCNGGLALLDPEVRRTHFITLPLVAVSPAWAPTGDVIALTDSVRGNLWLVAPDGSNARKVAIAGAERVRDPAWSPDGNHLVASCLKATNYDLCTFKPDGSDVVALTSESGSESQAAWSPDGSTIAFTLLASPTGEKEIALVPADGGTLTRLTQGFDPAWSRDGTALTFARGDGLFMIGRDGSNLRRLTTGNHYAPAWRP